MDKIDEFHLLIGETLMFCQTVELDIKYIYAAMLKGDMFDNYESIKSITLGQTLNMLKKLDHTDNNHFFVDADYKLLEEITSKRNHIVHKSYQEFVYEEEFVNSGAFKKEFDNLKAFHDRMESLSDNVEKVRLDALKYYKRD